MKQIHYNLNTSGRDFFVGDIHGCFSLVLDKMKEVKFDHLIDRIFSVGDLVDRGKESEQVVDWLKQSFFHAVKGNHEDMLLKYFLEPSNSYMYDANGGGWFINLQKENQDKIFDIVKNLPLQITVDTSIGKVGVIHAEVPFNDWTGCSIKSSNSYVENQMIWGRSKIGSGDTTRVENIDYVVVGHTPVKNRSILGNVCYIDTGAVYGNGLTFDTIENLVKV